MEDDGFAEVCITVTSANDGCFAELDFELRIRTEYNSAGMSVNECICKCHLP